MDRSLIIILLLLLVAVFDLKPRLQEYAAGMDRLQAMKKQLARERKLAEQQQAILKQIQEIEAIDAANNKMLYPLPLPDGAIQNELQGLISSILQKQNLTIQNISWGEPFAHESGDYLKLPITFSAAGNPRGIMQSLQELKKTDRYLHVPRLSLQKFSRRKQLVYKATVYAYKLKSENDSGKTGSPG